MKTILPIVACLLLLGTAFSQEACGVPTYDTPSVVLNPLKLIPKSDLPTQWSWGDVNGTNFLTLMRNQHIPTYCGSCWAFASTAALSDRIKIARNAAFPDINLAPQVLISCERPSHGCHGGSASTAYQYIYNYSITDETCTNYQARGWDNGVDCTQFIKCGNCNPNTGCFNQPEYYIYSISEYGTVKGENEIINELYQRGPVACYIDATLLHNYTGGIIATNASWSINHVVSITGYGEENSEPFWIVRNSWGTYWGENGFFRIYRGNNTLGIEDTCAWAVPKDTWTNGVKNTTEDILDSEQKTMIEEV